MQIVAGPVRGLGVATRAVPLELTTVRIAMAIDALRPQAAERGVGELGFGFRWDVTLQAIGLGVGFDQLEFRIAIVVEGELRLFPATSGMALRAVPFELAAMWVPMAVRTIRFGAAEGGGGEGLLGAVGFMTLFTGHLGVAIRQGELGVAVMAEGQLVQFPPLGAVTGGAASSEGFPMRILMATGAVGRQSLELRGGEGGSGFRGSMAF